MDRKSFDAELAAAFAGVRPDPDQTLHEAQLTDDGIFRSIGAAEMRAARAKDAHHAWTEVPAAALDACDHAMSHFTAQSWCFYLPAYMRRSLELFGDPLWDAEMLGSLIFHLTVKKEMPLCVARLTGAQKLAVRHFLELVEQESLVFIERTNSYCSPYDDAKAALDSYWGGIAA